MATAEEARPLYLDSSALIKLVFDEPESAALRRVVAARPIASSALALAELPRGARRMPAARATAQRQHDVENLLRNIDYVPLDLEQILRAGAFTEPWLRTLDALHLAAALTVAEDIDAFVTYDRRQARAVEHAGLPLLQPS